jgi:hypothetical protein
MNMEFWKEGHKIDVDIIEKLDKKFIEYIKSLRTLRTH